VWPGRGMERRRLGFGVFYFPADLSPPPEPSSEPLTLTLTNGTLDMIDIPNNDQLSAYPVHESPLAVLKALLTLSSHQSV
jgi:hypothetical protein